ncbi:MAG: hypothetical protein Q8P27_00765, partial [Candidatus Peregrinibacteria bacterium]|nr:hypothetical protein [Candidatus Peregrinibacteria bacterium]
MDARRLDYIARHMEETPHLGGEDEAVVVDGDSLEIIHEIGGQQPVQAIKARIAAALGENADLVNRAITADVTELTVERNPEPLRSPVSTAASIRLLTLAVDAALELLNKKQGSNIHLLHGATLRPPHATEADVSTQADTFKRAYYGYQTDLFGDQVAEAAGGHLNWSAPWLTKSLTSDQLSDALVRISGRMRLFGAALSIALSGSSPLTHTGNGNQRNAVSASALSPWNSTRLGHVWPNRTAMDASR